MCLETKKRIGVAVTGEKLEDLDEEDHHIDKPELILDMDTL